MSLVLVAVVLLPRLPWSVSLVSIHQDTLVIVVARLHATALGHLIVSELCIEFPCVLSSDGVEITNRVSASEPPGAEESGPCPANEIIDIFDFDVFRDYTYHPFRLRGPPRVAHSASFTLLGTHTWASWLLHCVSTARKFLL